ncbi:MAG: Rne/Rng family ribonuclease [Cyanobacteria bacterium J06635_11]
MPKQIVIAEQQRIAAVFSEDQIQEIIVATGSHQVGDIYLGTVENILPGIDAAFVNIGDGDKNGFMHVTDLGPLKLKRMASSITELLAPRQKVLVQIMKEPTGNKGPRLTGKVTLPGRYLVLMPYGKGVNLSRRIRNETERNRLRALGILIKPSGTGLLIRTEAEGVSEEAIIEDLEALQKRWENIQQEALATRPPSLLNRDDDFIQKVLRDVYSDEVNRIVTDTDSGLERTRKHLSSWSDGSIPSGILIDSHREPTHILEYFRVNAAIREAIKPRVDLPSGGYIIIEPTEALTVIDVNSGSFTRSATARETVLWTNCEAAVEIARQLRLRNVAGVIVVDFIDMDSRRDQMQVLEIFGKSLRADKSRPQISQLSELGLVELTRKRQGQNLYELFGQTCPTCGGLGHLAKLPGQEPQAATSLTVGVGRQPGYSSPSQSFSSRPSARSDRGGSSLESGSELQELDLLNHPNYQDKNGRGNRRRRRRGSESPGSNRGNRSAPGSPVPAIAKDTEERSQPRRSRAKSKSDERADIQQEERTHNEEPANKGKRGRNGRRKPEEPPEIVAVEMPLEEQRVYAIMGISPLVFTEQAVKDPENVAVSVVLPGEAEQFLADAKAAAEEAAANKRVIDAPSRLEKAPEAGQAEDSQESLADPAESSSGESGTPVEPEGSADNPSKAAPVRRRRRARQSRSSESTQAESQTESLAEDAESSPAATADNTPKRRSNPKPRVVNASANGKASGEAPSEVPEADAEPKKKVVRRRRRRSSAQE